MPRLAGPTPCWVCPKSDDKKTPAPHNELLQRHWQTINLYYQVRAGAAMPNDVIVRHNLGLIENVIQAIHRRQAAEA